MRLIKIGNYIPSEVKVDNFLEEVKTSLNLYYKDSKEWFKKNYEEILIPGEMNHSEERQFIIIYDVESECRLAGFALLKNTKKDKKIATLYVAKDWRNKGIGSLLLKEAVNYFNDRPYIFFSKEILLSNPLFSHVLVKNGFEFTEIKDDQYYFKYKEQ